jgi:hypothetical protein
MLDSTLACPGCKRRVITLHDILYAPLDGTARCRVCGRVARLDLFSRWIISCVIAVILPGLLLYWELFYSGHLFAVSLLFILVAWRILTFLIFPILALEEVAAKSAVDKKQSIVILAILLSAAMVIDGFISSRFESEQAGDVRRLTSSEPR